MMDSAQNNSNDNRETP